MISFWVVEPARGVEDDFLAEGFVGAWGHAGQGGGVAYEDAAAGGFCADYGFYDGGREVVAVGYYHCDEAIVCKASPDGVFVTWDYGGDTVAEMGEGAGAGIDEFLEVVGAGHLMAE